MNDLFAYDWGQAASNIARVLIAYILALPIGWEREREEHGVGIRTFPLVAMACCAFVLLGATFAKDDPAGRSRIIQGLIAGIGFIGGGAILKMDGGKGNGSVHGTATAASILNMGVLGAAVAQGRYEIGVLLMVMNLFTLHVLLPFKKKLDIQSSGPENK